MSLTRLWHTGRHLKKRQILARVGGSLRDAIRDYEAFFGQPSPPRPPIVWRPTRAFVASPTANTPDQLQAGRWTFLNETREIGFAPRWSPGDASRLWRYNLHYFDDLHKLSYTQAKLLAVSWIASHPLHRNHVGWEPYCVSLRLMNWCQVFAGRFAHELATDREFADVLWRSLYLQARWLSTNIEMHLMGNHLLENAAALLTVGTCFTGPDAAGWAHQGAKILLGQLDEQILPDGGHFERSPMYHSRVLQVLLNLANLDRPDMATRLDPAIAQMARALEYMTHADGRIALLNDAAWDIAPRPMSLLEAADRVSLSSRDATETGGAFALPHTGYYGWRSGGDLLICDAGAIGPDYIPGHAHGDIFSFELSLSGRRVIVDAGIHDYDVSPMRSYCRSTLAHNTVELARQDQCEFWKAFRVARRGRPRSVRFQSARDAMLLSGHHDAYRRLPGSPRHHRQFLYRREGVLIVRDRIESGSDCPAVSRLHLAPEVDVVAAVDNAVKLRSGNERICVRFAGPGQLRVKDSQYCPRLGQAIENKMLEFRTGGREMANMFCIARGLDEIPESLLAPA